MPFWGCSEKTSKQTNKSEEIAFESCTSRSPWLTQKQPQFMDRNLACFSKKFKCPVLCCACCLVPAISSYTGHADDAVMLMFQLNVWHDDNYIGLVTHICERGTFPENAIWNGILKSSESTLSNSLKTKIAFVIDTSVNRQSNKK